MRIAAAVFTSAILLTSAIVFTAGSALAAVDTAAEARPHVAHQRTTHKSVSVKLARAKGRARSLVADSSEQQWIQGEWRSANQ